MGGPLQGFRVLELTSTVSGPMAGMILADQGADVIKIEPPMLGDLARYMGSTCNGMGAMFSTLNRNKRSLILDLKDSADKSIFTELVTTADVLIENYRPGVMDSLGIGYEALSQLAPKLIYLSISGYGQTGPYAMRRVYDPLIQATAGTSAEQTVPYPTNVRTVIFDKVTAYTAAQAATAALLQRSRTGKGQHLPISMLQSALYYQWPDAMWSHTWQDKSTVHTGELADYFQIFQAADGYVAIILVADQGFAQFCELLSCELHQDDRLATFPLRLQNLDFLQEQLNHQLTTWKVEDLCEALDKIGVPVARVNRPEDIFDDPQIKAEACIIDTEHPVGGPMKIAATPFQFDGQQQLPVTHAPTHGQHSEEVLTEMNIDREHIERILAREKANQEIMSGFSLAAAR